MAITRKMDSVTNMKNDGQPFYKGTERFCDRDSGRIKRQNNKFEDELRPGRNGATYLDPCLHSHGPIDLVVLMLGTNDLKIRFQATPTDIGKESTA